MSTVFQSNATSLCGDDGVDDYSNAASVALLVVVVVSFLMSCTVIVVTVVSAKCVVKRGMASSGVNAIKLFVFVTHAPDK